MFVRLQRLSVCEAAEAECEATELYAITELTNMWCDRTC